MKVADEILQQIEYCINNNCFQHLENEKVELKDNSHTESKWTEVYNSVNAFLNTEGGMIFVGIKEITNKEYIITGFDIRNEPKIKELITTSFFTDEYGNKISTIDNIKYELRTISDKQVLLIFIDALADDEKYAFHKGEAYKRIITGDHKITPAEIEKQKEYKAEIENSRELQPAAKATIDDLDIDKLNDYIQLLNKEVKLQTIKSSMEDGITFLTNTGMLRERKPTILGVLVCGKDPGAILHWACEVNAYVGAATSEQVTQNKKIINGTVLELMEQSYAYVERNIQTGISIEKGGTKTYEYPMRLIRECINNALAHRDYSINKFVSIDVVPGKHIQIRNPGRFKPQLIINDIDNKIPIRRIITGNPKANNPKLAKILSVYNKWEGKGYGMATVVGNCLENKIDVPYYIFHSKDELSLFIPTGKLMDDTMEVLLTSYSGYIQDKLEADKISEDQKRILAYLYKSEQLNRADRYTILLTKDNNHLLAIQSLQDAGLIVRHEISDDIYSVFVLDENLFKKSFSAELHHLFGNKYKELPMDYKEVLSYIYERNYFGAEKYPSANIIGSEIWIKKGNGNQLAGFESYKRKIRNVVNKLQEGNFIVRIDNKTKYCINSQYNKSNSGTLF